MLLLAAPQALADSIRFEGEWQEHVQILGFEDGHVKYRDLSGVHHERKLDDLNGIRLGEDPSLGAALGAMAVGDYDHAVELLVDLSGRARQRWLQQYVARLTTTAGDKAGRPTLAVNSYIGLLTQGVPDAFLQPVPTESVLHAEPSEKRKVIQSVDVILPSVDDRRQKLLHQIVQAARSPRPVQQDAPDAGEPTRGPDGQVGPVSADRMLVPRQLERSQTVVLLRTGRYYEASKRADELLAESQLDPHTWYIKGLSQLAMAEESGDVTLYKDAGLNFMRVVVYFPGSAMGGPAAVEAGYIHQKLGRLEIAARLYEQAAEAIDPQAEPEYAQRFARLQAELESSAAEGDATTSADDQNRSHE